MFKALLGVVVEAVCLACIAGVVHSSRPDVRAALQRLKLQLTYSQTPVVHPSGKSFVYHMSS